MDDLTPHPAEPLSQPPPTADPYSEAQRQLDAARGHMQAMIAATDWAGLRESDPAEYGVRMMDRNEAERVIGQRQRELDTARQQQAYQQQAQMSHAQQSHLARERDALLGAIPAWRDPATRIEQSRQLRDWAIGEGYSAEDLANLSDHRMVRTLHKAWRADTAPAKNVDGLRDKLRASKTKGQGRRKGDNLSDQVKSYLKETGTKRWSGEGPMDLRQATAHVMETSDK